MLMFFMSLGMALDWLAFKGTLRKALRHTLLLPYRTVKLGVKYGAWVAPWQLLKQDWQKVPPAWRRFRRSDDERDAVGREHIRRELERFANRVKFEKLWDGIWYKDPDSDFIGTDDAVQRHRADNGLAWLTDEQIAVAKEEARKMADDYFMSLYLESAESA